jgi:hypothetical protein
LFVRSFVCLFVCLLICLFVCCYCMPTHKAVSRLDSSTPLYAAERMALSMVAQYTEGLAYLTIGM